MKIDLRTRAMMARLSISVWSARRTDKRVTEEIAQRHNVAATVGQYRKSLIDRAELHDLSLVAREAREYHYKMTLPWKDSGARLLPVAASTAYTDKMRDLRQTFEGLVGLFVDRYPGMITDARRALNGLFVESEYPIPENIAGHFAFGVELEPIPHESDFRLDIPEAQIKRLESDFARSTENAVAQAMADVWARVRDVVAHAADTFADPDKIFRNSTVENVGAVADLVDQLNVTTDPQLAAVAARLRAGLAALDPDQIRTDAAARAAADTEARAVLDQIAAATPAPADYAAALARMEGAA